jgi:hypothetical protein
MRFDGLLPDNTQTESQATSSGAISNLESRILDDKRLERDFITPLPQPRKVDIISIPDDSSSLTLYRKRDVVENTKNPSNVPIIISAPMPPDPGDDEQSQCDQGVSLFERQAQSKFKHAEDFGILGNYNKVRGQEFVDTLKDFITSESVYKKEILYRGEKRCIYIDKETDRGVLTKDGQFESGWKLTPKQLREIILRNRLS